MVENSNKKDFSNGKIYCIRNNIDDNIYIGSTCQKLCKRFSNHRAGINHKRDGNMLLYQKMRELGKEHFYIELIEDYLCENVEQLRKREGEIIRELKPVLNQRIEGRTNKEWRDENREHLKELYRVYYSENKDAINEQKKEYNKIHAEEIKVKKAQKYQQNKEVLQEKSREYHYQNKAERNEKSKHYYEGNKEQILEKLKQVIECPCGVNFTHSHKSRHLKSKHHQNYENSLSENND